MGDFRVRYGAAYGPYGNVAYTSGLMQFGNDDSTPDVSNGSFFLTNNTGATTITYFDVTTPGGLVSQDHQGKSFTLLINDTATTIANAGQIFLPGTNAAYTTGALIQFIYYNSSWYATSVEENLRSDVQNVTLLGTGAPNVDNAKLIIVTGSGGTTSVITGLSGGVAGQLVTVMKVQTAVVTDTALKLLGTGQLQLAGTAALLMSSSLGYTFVCDAGSRFTLISPTTVP